ncbi:MAG: small multi-drug export protein [Clostridia bacterium]|nr:small multi-drug export protein [Clostridia bacterium]
MVKKILDFLAFLPKEIYVFLISMLPIIELRGAVPVGAAIGLPFYLNYIVAVIGNVLPVPFILMFIPRILDLMEKVKLFRPVVKWVRQKAEKYKGNIITVKDESCVECGEDTETLNAGFFIALMMFVAIPLPGTGAWTGSLVAALFNLPKRSSMLAISLGVLICGIIMCLASYGVLGFLSILL